MSSDSAGRASRGNLTATLLLGATLILAGCGRTQPGSDGADSDTGGDQSLTDRDAGGQGQSPRQWTLAEIEQKFAKGQEHFQQFRLFEAEAGMREVLRLVEPRLQESRLAVKLFLESTQVLAEILNRQSRRWEAESLLFGLLRARVITVEELLFLGNRSEMFSDPNFTNQALQSAPDDPMPLLTVARERQATNQIDEALGFVDLVLEQYPDQVEAIALRGLLLVEANRDDAFRAWSNGIGSTDEAHPDVWLARAMFAWEHEQVESALRCYWEVVRRDPNHQLAHYRLGLLLRDQGRTEEAVAFMARAELLNELHSTLHPMYKEGTRAELVRKAAELTQRLGRIWESWAWHSVLEQSGAGDEQSRVRLQQLETLLSQHRPPRVIEAEAPGLQLDLSSFPVLAGPGATAVRTETPDALPRPGFRDVSAEVGLAFDYYSSPDETTEGLRMFETTGGGAGVLDYDRDGWPDLYFTQGAPWPVDETDRRYLDRCYRNVEGRRLVDVTDVAGLGDGRFSQGLAVGDINNDGFPDLYIANIGLNRLYLNLGDGTFEEVPWSDFGDRRIWTTSCLIADLNADGLPDIYDANYLGGEDIHDRICGAQVRRACAPSVFDGEQDQIYLNRGDGRFEDVSEAAAVARLKGKGLGLIAADFDGSGSIAVFVANDAVANHFLVNRAAPGDVPQFVDVAMANGLAFDRDARFQACMGVAFDDADADGRFDLFVTNYYNDSNTLYVQEAGMMFDDQTRKAGLRDPGFRMLGFGTQFLDIELDGLPDLVIANGHVDDYSHEGAPFRMRPQLMSHQRSGVYLEIPETPDGNYFSGEYRGRGLALLDWNRDGREDFAVSHLDSASALVLNETLTPHHFLSLQLVGTSLSRDAIGTTVWLEAGDLRRTRQLAAGSGYQASNEPRLLFGLGPETRVDRLQVRWPDGELDSYSDLDVDREWVIIQGEAPLEVPR